MFYCSRRCIIPYRFLSALLSTFLSSRSVSSTGELFGSDPAFDFRTVQVTFVVIDHEMLLTVIRIAPLLCTGMYRIYQILAKVITISGYCLTDGREGRGGCTALW
jgi:hypothetical protein